MEAKKTTEAETQPVNREGLTFDEWFRAMYADAETPAMRTDWKDGVDPCEWRARLGR